ncbi:hypothetical protein P8C59_007042 [Phyllachora maydis]|uniref:Uncharacterized protein n=1 Tax=Phyllachora maydis TaxID=1825666 RepID=A0AAD9MD56_9PEZI|nr:hypothetical protein P8C59_007042 [Phyllachora maydis]
MGNPLLSLQPSGHTLNFCRRIYNTRCQLIIRRFYDCCYTCDFNYKDQFGYNYRWSIFTLWSRFKFCCNVKPGRDDSYIDSGPEAGHVTSNDIRSGN